MSDSNDRIREKMLKLLALARRGEGGEKENAQRFLERMLKQHGMTMADLDDAQAPKEWRGFSCKTKLEKTLLLQIVVTVLNVRRVFSRTYGKGKKIHYELTKAQYLDVSMQFAVYSRELQKSIDNLLLAFIHKNQITGPMAEDDGEEKQSTLSKEDIEAIRAMMTGMKRVPVHKAIEAAA